MAPLLPVADLGGSISNIDPIVVIGGRGHAFIAQSLTTLTRAELGERPGNLAEHHNAFTRALDLLLTGF